MSEILSVLARGEHFAKNPKYKQIYENMLLMWEKNPQGVIEESKKLPTDDQLFATLVEKLKNKSVYSRLKDLTEKKELSNNDLRICYSSLLTHIFIECKQNPEYELLVEPTLQKLYTLI